MHREFKLLVGLVACAAIAEAQNGAAAADSGTTDASSVILAKKPATPPFATYSSSYFSPAAAATLSRSMPATGLTANTQGSVPAGPDLSGLSRAKNPIPRLPVQTMSKYTVREYRLPLFRQRDLFTKDGLVALSMRDHPGLHAGNLFGLNSDAAYAMYLDDERLDAKEDLEDTAHAIEVGGDPAEARAIRKATEDAFFRQDQHTGAADTPGALEVGGPPDDDAR